MSEDYGGVSPEESALRRAANRENSARILREKGIAFEERNAGAHLIVKAKRGFTFADFWPGTGLFIARGGQVERDRLLHVNMLARGRGVRPLGRERAHVQLVEDQALGR